MRLWGRSLVGRLRATTQPMTLRVKLDLMLLIPLLALLVFAGGAVHDKLSDRQAAAEMRRQAELSLLAGQLVHELQSERGLSGIAVSTDRSLDADLLAQQERVTEVYARFASEVQSIEVPVDLRFTAARVSVEARWEQLQGHRQLVLEDGVDARVAMRPYTSLIEQLLLLTTQTNIVQRDASPLNSVHWDFLHAKERSALIRGTLGAAAARGSLSEAERQELQSLVTEEQVYLDSFTDRAPREVLSAYRTALAGVGVRSALALRSELLSGYLIDSGPDGGLVFESLSGHVDGLLILEQAIVEEIVGTATEREAAATLSLVVIGSGAVLLLAVSFVVLAVGARSITRPLKGLARSAQQIAEGDLEAESSEWADDAIGEIGNAFDDMRGYLAEMAHAAEELAWGNLDTEVEPRSQADTFGHSIAAMTRRLSLMMVESEFRAEELEGTVERLRTSEEELRQAATHDGLTGLPNRAHFMDRLEVELGRARRAGTEVAVAFIDLIKFKAVNDTLGHHAGDRLLEMVAERLRSEIRASDTVARLGGDEFALILPDLHKEVRPNELLQRLVDALSVPYRLHGAVAECPPSVGIAMAPSDAQGADTLLAKADHAMYEAKRQGDGAFCFVADIEPRTDVAV